MNQTRRRFIAGLAALPPPRHLAYNVAAMSRTKQERIIIIVVLTFLILITLFLLNFNSNPFPQYERGPDGKGVPRQ